MSDKNRAANYNDFDDKAWESGWLLGKYNQQVKLPSAGDGDYILGSFCDGFIKGACEVGEYKRLNDYAKECIPNASLLDYFVRVRP